MKFPTSMTARKQYDSYWECDLCKIQIHDNEMLQPEEHGETYCPKCMGTSFTEMKKHTVFIEVYAANEIDAVDTAFDMQDEWETLDHTIRLEASNNDR